MANDVLSSLLREYEQKKFQAELDLEKRKENIYALYPRLKEIDDELHRLEIESAKSILNHQNNSSNKNNLKINNLKDEKKNILLKNGYDLNFFTPHYDCPICKDTGYVVSDNYITSMCSCLKQKLLDISFNKSNMFGLKKENFENFNENYFSDEVDLSKYKFNISPRKNIKNIKNKCLEFIDNFENLDSKNLLFTGATGLR